MIALLASKAERLCSSWLVFSLLFASLVQAGDAELSHELAVHPDYFALETEAGFEACNPGQGWHILFDGRGFAVHSETGSWEWGLELASYGFAGSELAVADLASASADCGRIAYRWDESLEEWYVNDARGIEHGYTVFERPDGEQALLTFTLRVRGDLTPRVQASRRAVSFLDASGATVLSYSGLVVFDAEGRVLPAWFEHDAGGLRLSVDERGAVYPLTVDPIAQEAYIKASNAGAGDVFGASVALFGDTLVVGATNEGSAATGIDGDQTSNAAGTSGAVYVFVRSGATWTQQAYLKASNTDPADNFGATVAISGDTILVGSPNEDSAALGVGGLQADNSAINSGAAYVFVRTGTVWSQQAYLKASNTGSGDAFGQVVAISLDTLVVGARYEDSDAVGIGGDPNNDNGIDSGAAYVFVRNGTTWTQEAYLKASNSEGGTPFFSGDLFGSAVAISGERLVVGAFTEDSQATGVGGDQLDNSQPASGAAYVFVRSGTTWNQEAYLKASNTESVDQFGLSMSLAGDTLAIGARLESSAATGVNGDQTNNDADRSGAVYVFVRGTSGWDQEAYLKASNTNERDVFGLAVSVSGDRLVVGASAEGSAAVGINGDQAHLGALSSSTGAAYVFDRNGTSWNQVAHIKSSNPDSFDEFGDSVAVSGNAFVVGAPNEDSAATGINGDPFDESAPNAGAAYAFDLDFDFGGAPVGIDFCSGDGGDQLGCTNCPCSNNAPAGTVGGCLNSASTSARLSAAGDPSVTLPNGDLTDLRFALTGTPPGVFCFLLSGEAVAPTNPLSACVGLASGTQAMAFDGLRCAVMNVLRHDGRLADASGSVGVTNSPWGGEGGPPAGIALAGAGFIAGQTRYFQVVHRDDPLLACMRGLNTSQAVEIAFTP